MRVLRIGFILVAVTLLACHYDLSAADGSAVFVGTTPCGERMKKLLELPQDGSEALRWSLTLEKDDKSRVPARYKMECRCVAQPGVNEKITFTARRAGSCTPTKGA